MSASRKLQLRCIWWGLVYAIAALGAMICVTAFVFWEWTWPSEWEPWSRVVLLLLMATGFAWGAADAALRRQA